MPATVRVSRKGDEIAEAQLTLLKRGPQEASEVIEGELCGISLKTSGKLIIEEGDELQFFTREVKERTL